MKPVHSWLTDFACDCRSCGVFCLHTDSGPAELPGSSGPPGTGLPSTTCRLTAPLSACQRTCYAFSLPEDSSTVRGINLTKGESNEHTADATKTLLKINKDNSFLGFFFFTKRKTKIGHLRTWQRLIFKYFSY